MFTKSYIVIVKIRQSPIIIIYFIPFFLNNFFSILLSMEFIHRLQTDVSLGNLIFLVASLHVTRNVCNL